MAFDRTYLSSAAMSSVYDFIVHDDFGQTWYLNKYQVILSHSTFWDVKKIRASGVSIINKRKCILHDNIIQKTIRHSAATIDVTFEVIRTPQRRTVWLTELGNLHYIMF